MQNVISLKVDVILMQISGLWFFPTHYSFSPYSAFALAGVACQVLEGLSFLHDRHIVHRNLSPENILITAEVIINASNMLVMNRPIRLLKMQLINHIATSWEV